jgi:hypothetical protein
VFHESRICTNLLGVNGLWLVTPASLRVLSGWERLQRFDPTYIQFGTIMVLGVVKALPHEVLDLLGAEALLVLHLPEDLGVRDLGE